MPTIRFHADNFEAIAQAIEETANHYKIEVSAMIRDGNKIAYDDGVFFGLMQAARILRTTVTSFNSPPDLKNARRT